MDNEMKQGFPKIAVFVSIAVHLALLGFLFWGGRFFRGVEFHRPSGGGGSVSVWLTPGEPFSSGAGNGEKSPVPLPSVRQKSGPMPDKGLDKKGGGGGEEIGSGTGSGIGAGDGEGLGGGGDLTLAKIKKKIMNSKYYPQLARENRIEGTPRVTFEINEDGSLKVVVVAASSGKALLDEAALETVRRAAPLPYFPGPITLTIKYSLKD